MNSKIDIRVKLSLLWTVLMINMIFNDILSIMITLVDKKPLDLPGEVGILMAVAAIITNIPIFMILLSRILKYKINRILNIAAGIFTIVYVIGGGDTALHYIIIAAIETILAIVIIVSAWRWKEEPQAALEG